jgi:hypothetical protein
MAAISRHDLAGHGPLLQLATTQPTLLFAKLLRSRGRELRQRFTQQL